MKLRRQLLLVSLLVLLLPWVGYQYLQQVGHIMMEGEAAAKTARAEAMVAYLESRPQLFRPLLYFSSAPRIYIPLAETPPLVDGSGADWPNQDTSGGPERPAFLRVGDTLYLSLLVDASENQPELRLFFRDRTLDLPLLDNGDIRGVYLDSSEREPSILGKWVTQGEKTGIEVALPITLTRGYLGLSVEQSGVRLGLDQDGQAVPWVTWQPEIAEALQIFSRTSSRTEFVTADQLVVASNGVRLAEGLPPQGWEAFALALLGGSEPEVEGTLGEQWQLRVSPPRLTTTTQVSIGGLHVGWLRTESELDNFLDFYTGALRQFFWVSLLVFALVGLGLLGYASWLSWRITRLSRWTRKLVDARGQVDTSFTASRTGDEIGELSRDYADLTRRLQGYTHYLKGLAGRLSHEIRTPLAIVGSSLDNLEATSDPEARKTYLERAKQGMERLRTLLRNMSEASALEASIDQAKGECFEPEALVKELVAAYQQVFTASTINYLPATDANACRIWGSPDLLAQMLDKLMDNAQSFATEDTEILISTSVSEHHWHLSIRNQGPLLPEGDQLDIFTSLVSVRQGDGKGAAHLGLGLSIVKRILEFHGGKIEARNLDDKSGVEFEVILPTA